MPMDSIESLQDLFINDLINNQRVVSVYLKNSIRLKGRLISHNEEVIFLRQGSTQMVYKKIISTISPETVFETY
jgi:RNA chaperone Hfq